jgi:hypothetical protein
MASTSNTGHFSAGDWVDSVRGLLPEQRSSELQKHLDRGCLECVQSLAFWSELAELLAREPRYEPPGYLLRAAEQAYAGHRPWQWLRAGARWAEQLFDSFHQPLVAPVRGSAPALSDRRLVHEAKPFIIDVTMRTDLRQSVVRLMGQILNVENPVGGSSAAEVVLLNRDDLVAKTAATDNGEFELECESQPNLSLFISIRGEQAIGIRLPEGIK